MTTSMVKLEIYGGTTSVDFSIGMGIGVQYVMNNPLFIMPMGMTNQFVVDLKLISTRFLLTFDLTDGVEDGSNFQKLREMSLTLQVLKFTFGTKEYKVSMESFVAGTQPGKMDYMPGCQIVLIVHGDFDPSWGGFLW